MTWGEASRSGCLSKDSDWSEFEGLICRVKRFTPFATVENGRVVTTNRTMPYALVALECCEKGVDRPPDAVGAIRHRLDFQRLWWAFVERDLGDDETVFVVWSKRNLKATARLFSPFMPRLAVTIFKTEAWKLLSESGYRPDLGGEAKFLAELPIHHWQPGAWRDRLVSTLLEQYASSYLRTGDEKYLSLMNEYR